MQLYPAVFRGIEDRGAGTKVGFVREPGLLRRRNAGSKEEDNEDEM